MHARNALLAIVFVSATSAAQGVRQPGPEDALREWRARFGERWSTHVDAVTQRAELVYGGRADFGATPKTDEEWFARGQVAIAGAGALLGVDVGSLVADKVTFLPLGIVGSGDKWSVEFRQEFGGVRVVEGDVVLLFDARGGLLSIQNQALTDVTELELQPLFASALAADQARLAFEKEHAPVAGSVSAPELVVVKIDAADGRVGHLAWQIDVEAIVQGSDPVGRRYWIDARSGYPLRDETTVHHFDISGNVSTMATPGTKADTATNAETLQPAKYIAVNYSGGTVYTDANGDFTIPGVNTAENVTFTYAGLFAQVDDDPTGLPYSEIVGLFPGPGNQVVLNAAAIDTITAQANIFNHVATMRDFVRATNPADATADAPYAGHANIAATCNAFYNGSINFYAAGGSCNNTGFSTVVGHEEGHGLNVRYGTNNGSDGMGEGNADVWTLYAFDTPLNGEGFFTSGGAVRTGNNTRQFCGDCRPACWGEVHRDGEPWMGAAWKVRQNLNVTLGNTLGDLTANQLFLAWMNAYNQRQIQAVIELQWLILDDDDANLLNGTPHAADIKNGFRAQGFPGYDIEFASASSIADSSCEAASYPVNASVHTVQGTTITGVALRWRTNGGAWITQAMQPAGGDTWSGRIPYVVSPANVDFEVVATDSAGNTKEGFCGTRSFFVGQVVAFASEGFESSTTWVTGSVGDTANLNNDWQRGTPAGKTGTSSGVPWADPAAAGVGNACIGNDLGLSGGNGAYQSDVHSYLLSPAFDCTGQTGVHLIFKRWLTVEKSQFDTARILVNNTEVWRNPSATNLLDTSWSTQSIDISALADNNASVVIQFELQTDGGLNLGGWQIDGLALGHLERGAQCAAVQSFCAGDGSLATACPCNNFGAAGHGCADLLVPQGGLLAASGTPATNTVVLVASSVPAGSLGVYLQQDGLSEFSFQNGVMCGGGNLLRLRVRSAVGGTSSLPDLSDGMPLSTIGLVTPGSGARRYYSLWYRGGFPAFCSPGAANLTNSIMVTW